MIDEPAPDVVSDMETKDAASREAGVRVLAVGPGTARARLVVEPRHLNGHGICHGGYLFLLADTTFAFACNSHGVPAVAAGGDITFLRPVTAGVELVAEAVERALAGRSGVYDVTVRAGAAADAEVVAEFRGRSRQVPGLTAPR